MIGRDPNEPLFPELIPQGPGQRRSAAFSDRFAYYRRGIEVYQPRIDFHSFRGNVETDLKNTEGINTAWIDELIGHESIIRRSEGDRYTKKIHLPILRRLVNSISIEAELGHLRYTGLRGLPQKDRDRTLANFVALAEREMSGAVTVPSSYALLPGAYRVELGSQHQEDLRVELEEFCFGWAALPSCTHLSWTERRSVALSAISLGARMASARVKAAKATVWRHVEEEAERRKFSEAGATTDVTARKDEDVTAPFIPEGHVIVAKIEEGLLKNSKLKDLVGPLRGAINKPLPLVLSPPLHEARARLMAEFPYATEAIDTVLTDLIGRTTVKLRPLLLLGAPGGGKSRFVRRLGEVLTVHVWRTDASRSDGAAFAGTDKRWYSAEPCHPFLAIHQANHANPLILLDELEKAGTRTDYGRLWDCLLGFLEPETAARYPDPALQINLDLSHVSYLATANSLDPLPGPIRDRFRIVAFPKPTKGDLDALLPGVVADFASQRGLDARWIAPLNDVERTVVENHWPGGSVRRLHRVVHALLQDREVRATRN